MNQFFTVLNYTFKNKIKSKGFIFLTAFLLISSVLLVKIPNIYNSFQKQNKYNLAIVDSTGVFKPNMGKLNDYLHNECKISNYDESQLNSLKEQVQKGKIHEIVFITKSGNGFQSQFIVKNVFNLKYDQLIRSYINEISLMMSLQNESQALAGKVINSNVKSKIVELQKNTLKTVIPAYLILFLLYMFIMIYGVLVSSSIVTEKSSKIMEVLITSTKPMTLFFGKTIGIGLAGLSQLLLCFLGAILSYNIGAKETVDLGGLTLDFSVLSADKIFFIILFFVLGYFLYGVLFAGAGSLVSKAEDSTVVILPIIFLIVIAFIFGMLSLKNPNDTLSVVSSFIPFTSPIVMCVRVILSSASAWEITSSIVVLLLSTALFTWISTKIFRVGILLKGKVPSPREVIRALAYTRV